MKRACEIVHVVVVVVVVCHWIACDLALLLLRWHAGFRPRLVPTRLGIGIPIPIANEKQNNINYTF